MTISQAALDLIITEETGGEAYYNQCEMHPDWPGGASGVTIGCGYDCGYSTPAQIRADWQGVLPDGMVVALISIAGIHGSPAHSVAHELNGVVSVTWDQALRVFQTLDVPRWTSRVQTSLANSDKLSGDSFGALVSLAFNRGCSFTLPGDRYKEMRDIKAHMAALQFAMIPDAIRSMKRLWSNSADLRARRDHEAALFAKGLS